MRRLHLPELAFGTHIPCGSYIKHKTTYRVQFDNEKLVKECAKALGECPPITKTRLQWRKADLAIGKAGVEAIE